MLLDREPEGVENRLNFIPHMKIHIQQIPEDGQHLAGEEEGDFIDLEREGIRAVAPVRYSLDVGLSDGGFFAVGRLSTVVEMECVNCLQRFPQPVEVPDFAVQMPLPGPELVDLTPMIREDIVLSLPSYPHCDQDGARTCERPRVNVSDASPEPEEDHAWDVLEKLRFEKGK